MTTALEVIRLAEDWIGRREQPPGSNRVAGCTDWYGLIGPWCGMWISRVFWDAGLPLSASTAKGFAYTPAGAQWFKDQGRWHTRPEVGDVCFMGGRPFGTSRISHVGLVVKVSADGYPTNIEGNTDERGGRTGGKVMRQVRRSGIYGYGRPAYRIPTAQEVAALVPTMVHFEPTKSGNGYTVFTADGGVFAYGDAEFHGSMGGKPLASPITDVAMHPSGHGYWLLSKADRGIFGFGEAKFYGSPNEQR